MGTYMGKVWGAVIITQTMQVSIITGLEINMAWFPLNLEVDALHGCSCVCCMSFLVVSSGANHQAHHVLFSWCSTQVEHMRILLLMWRATYVLKMMVAWDKHIVTMIDINMPLMCNTWQTYCNDKTISQSDAAPMVLHLSDHFVSEQDLMQSPSLPCPSLPISISAHTPTDM